MHHKLILIMGMLLALPVISHAAIYKWVDEQGNVHYSQQKPKQSVATEKMKVQSRAPENKSTYNRPSLGDKNADDKKTEPEEQAKAEAPKIDPKVKKQACASARANLATLLSRGQIRQRDAEGNVNYLSEQQKQARIKRTREIINQNCQ